MASRSVQIQLAYSEVDAAAMVSVSERTLREEVNAGKIAPRWLRGRKVFLHSELEAYLASLPFDKPQ